MDNFFNYVTKQIKPEEVDIWFKSNNIIPEKLELFSDFCQSLNELIVETYLGESDSPNETKVNMSEEDKIKHFIWCWNKVVSNFEKEKINFNVKGEHFDYFVSFFEEIFYKQENKKVRNSVKNFFEDLFDLKTPFTKSDLDMINTVYKSLEKNIIK
jgi:hypothetical protein